MAEIMTKQTKVSPVAFINMLKDPRQRADADEIKKPPYGRAALR